MTRSVAARLAKGDRPAAARVASTGLWLLAGAAIVGCALAGAVALGVTTLVPVDDLTDGLRLTIVLFAFQAMFELATSGMSSVLEGFQRVGRSRQLDVVRRTLVLGTQTVVALATGELAATVGAGVVASAVATVLLAATVWREGVRSSFERSVAGELLRYGRTLSALRPIGVIQRSMDKVLVAIVLGPAAVVGVELATQLQNGVHAIMTSVSYAALPGSSFLHGGEDRHRLRRLVEIGTRFVVLATWPAAVLAIVLREPILEVWVGPSQLDAAGLAAVALAYLVVVAPLQVGSNMLVGTGRAGVNIRVMSVAIVVNLVLSIGLVVWLGAVGTFLGTLLTSLLIFPMFLTAFAEEIDVPRKELLRVGVAPVVGPTLLAAAVAGAVVAAPFGDLATLLVGAGAGALAFGASALRWGIDREELGLLRDAVTGRRRGAPTAPDPT